MHEGKRVIHSTNTTKKKRKSSFRCSTMKVFKNVREYKKTVKNSSDEPSSVTKSLRYPSRRFMKKSDTIIN
jgi:hypothetical protein